jgi:probable rRNA maturation factor
VIDVSGLEQVNAASRARIRRRIARVLRSAGVSADAVSIAFVDDGEMRALNRIHRGKNKPTDVLSFSTGDDGLPDAFAHLLGDLVISLDTARTQALLCRHSIDVEIAVLVAHGVLHLLGFDHERGTSDARAQAEAELTVLDGAGVPVEAALIGRSHTF